MKTLVITFVALSAFAACAVVMSAAEQYHALKTAKIEEDASAKKKLQSEITEVAADRDVKIYNGFLKLKREKGLGDRLLKFTGTVTQKIDVALGKRQLVVQVRGIHGMIEVVSDFKAKIPESVRIGDTVVVSGMFNKGNLTWVELKNASVLPISY